MSPKYVSGKEIASAFKRPYAEIRKWMSESGQCFKRKDGDFGTRKTTAIAFAHKNAIKIAPKLEKDWSAMTKEKRVAPAKKSKKTARKTNPASSKKNVKKNVKAIAPTSPANGKNHANGKKNNGVKS